MNERGAGGGVAEGKKQRNENVFPELLFVNVTTKNNIVYNFYFFPCFFKQNILVVAKKSFKNVSRIGGIFFCAETFFSSFLSTFSFSLFLLYIFYLFIFSTRGNSCSSFVPKLKRSKIQEFVPVFFCYILIKNMFSTRSRIT